MAMIARRNIEICQCGTPRQHGDRVVIVGDHVYCNAFCQMKNGKEEEPREHRTDSTA